MSHNISNISNDKLHKFKSLSDCYFMCTKFIRKHSGALPPNINWDRKVEAVPGHETQHMFYAH